MSPLLRRCRVPLRGCGARAGLATHPTFEVENVGGDIDSYFTMYQFTGRGAAIAARWISVALPTTNE